MIDELIDEDIEEFLEEFCEEVCEELADEDLEELLDEDFDELADEDCEELFTELLDLHCTPQSIAAHESPGPLTVTHVVAPFTHRHSPCVPDEDAIEKDLEEFLELVDDDREEDREEELLDEQGYMPQYIVAHERPAPSTSLHPPQ